MFKFAICIYTKIHIHTCIYTLYITISSLYHHYTLYVPYATCLNLIQTRYFGGSAASPRLQQSRDNPCPSFGSRESLEQPRHQMTPVKWEKVGGLWPDQNVTAWWLYVNVNLNESQWLLVPPPSDVELPQKTRDQTWDQTRDHVVQLGITRFNSVH